MKNKGFTLVEVLIVVAIIGLIAAIAIPNFQAAQKVAEFQKITGIKDNDEARDYLEKTEWDVEKAVQLEEDPSFDIEKYRKTKDDKNKDLSLMIICPRCQYTLQEKVDY